MIDNRKAYHDYHIIEEFVAGIKLLGHEVKSIKSNEGSLVGGYVSVRDGGVSLLNFYVKPNESYAYGNEPNRAKVLLLNASEISKIAKHVEQKGHTCVPLCVFVNDKGLVKVKIGLARGKNAPDKREAQKIKDLNRQIREEI